MYADDANPYRSPLTAHTPLCVIDADANAPICSKLVDSRALYRCVQLSGRWNAEIVWNAWGFEESIRVNGKKLASGYSYVRPIPKFQFPIETAIDLDPVLVTVEVWCVWVFVTKAMRITIGGIVAYAEGAWAK